MDDPNLAPIQNQIQALEQQVADLRARAAPPPPPDPPVAAVTAAAGINKPNVRFNTFSNEPDEDFLVFRHHIDKVVRLNQYSDEQARLALASAMKGRAAAAVMDIDPLDQNATYPLLMGAYENRFLPAASSQLARMKFDATKQGNNESVLDYHSRLRTLYNKAYPQAMDEVILIRRFALGLRRREVRTQVMRGQPANYAQALEMAQNETSVLQMVRVSEGGSGEPMEVNALNPDHQTLKCYYCGIQGHVRSDCRKLKKDRANGQVKGQKGQGQGQPGNRGGQAAGRGEKPGRSGKFVAAIQALLEHEDGADATPEVPSGPNTNTTEDF